VTDTTLTEHRKASACNNNLLYEKAAGCRDFQADNQLKTELTWQRSSPPKFARSSCTILRRCDQTKVLIFVPYSYPTQMLGDREKFSFPDVDKLQKFQSPANTIFCMLMQIDHNAVPHNFLFVKLGFFNVR
jgi:hypothetical protein